MTTALDELFGRPIVWPIDWRAISVRCEERAKNQWELVCSWNDEWDAWDKEFSDLVETKYIRYIWAIHNANRFDTL